MKLATWNVNSVRARLPRLETWLDAWRPDVLCLQETKVPDDQFPRQPCEQRGYALTLFGQRTYNGVALLTRRPAEEVMRGLPGDPPAAERRLVAARLGDLWVYSVYVPNGTALGSERFAYKLDWLQRLRAHLEQRHDPADGLLLCGDFNVAPEDRDVHDPEAWRGKLLFHPDEQAALRHLMDWGLHDALRARTAQGGLYTWWDYRAGAFHRGWGLRIDLVLVSAPLLARLREVRIDREARKGPKPSDHAPVVITLE